jgi:hypothetical protein
MLPTRKQRILFFLAHSDRKELEFVRQLSELEQEKADTPQARSAKDLLLHISAMLA